MGELYSVLSQIQVHLLCVAVDYTFKYSLHSLITVANGFPVCFPIYNPHSTRRFQCGRRINDYAFITPLIFHLLLPQRLPERTDTEALFFLLVSSFAYQPLSRLPTPKLRPLQRTNQDQIFLHFYRLFPGTLTALKEHGLDYLTTHMGPLILRVVLISTLLPFGIVVTPSNKKATHYRVTVLRLGTVLPYLYFHTNPYADFVLPFKLQIMFVRFGNPFILAASAIPIYSLTKFPFISYCSIGFRDLSFST